MASVAEALQELGITEWVLRGEPTTEDEFNTMFAKVTGADSNGSAIESSDPADFGTNWTAVKAKMDEIIRKICDSGYHPSGTVPMGADDDATAALDGRGRVRGVSGLAVADASIFPTVPSVNINIPTIMVGERFGEWARNGDLFAA